MTRFDLQYERSLALHAAVAKRVAVDPALVERARRKLAEWQERGGSSARLWERWQCILSQAPDAVIAFMTARTQEAAWLRTASPFAGMLPERERQQILRDVRRSLEQSA